MRKFLLGLFICCTACQKADDQVLATAAAPTQLTSQLEKPKQTNLNSSPADTLFFQDMTVERDSLNRRHFLFEGKPYTGVVFQYDRYMLRTTVYEVESGWTVYRSEYNGESELQEEAAYQDGLQHGRTIYYQKEDGKVRPQFYFFDKGKPIGRSRGCSEPEWEEEEC